MIAGKCVAEDASLTLYAWRVHPKYRGLGIGSSLKKYYYQNLQQFFDCKVKYLYEVRAFQEGWDKQVILSQRPDIAVNYVKHMICSITCKYAHFPFEINMTKEKYQKE